MVFSCTLMYTSELQTMEIIPPAQEVSLSHKKPSNHTGISYESENLTGVKISSHALTVFSSFQVNTKLHSTTHFALPSPMMAQP
jgi:hypothetical protein